MSNIAADIILLYISPGTNTFRFVDIVFDNQLGSPRNHNRNNRVYPIVSIRSVYSEDTVIRFTNMWVFVFRGQHFCGRWKILRITRFHIVSLMARLYYLEIINLDSYDGKPRTSDYILLISKCYRGNNGINKIVFRLQLLTVTSVGQRWILKYQQFYIRTKNTIFLFLFLHLLNYILKVLIPLHL